MITGFQRYFGKHFKWVLLIFLFVLLFSFIVSIGAVPQLNLNGRQAQAKMFLGVDTSDSALMQNLAGQVQLAYQSLYKYQVTTSQDLTKLVLQRIVLMHLADEWHIPQPTPKQMEDYLRSARAFRDPEGKFSDDLYSKFKDSVDTSPNRDAILASLTEDCRLDRVRSILGGPGYVVPALATFQVATAQVKSNVVVGTLDYKNFTPKIDLTGDKLTAALQAIFTKDPAQFPLPATANLAYVKFLNSTNPAPTDAQLKDYLAQNKDTFPDLHPDQLTDKDKKTLADAWSTEQTANQTMAYARELLTLKAKPGSPAFDALLKKYNLKFETLPTVVQDQPAPKDSPIPDDVLQQVAFNLTPDQPFAPVHLDDGAAVVYLLNSTPPATGTFDQVRDQVMKTYTDSQKQLQFNQRCTAVHDAIAKAMAAGATFADAAKAQGLDVKTFPDVTYDDIQKTLSAMPMDASDKTTPLPDSPLTAMGRDAMTVLATSNSNGIPQLAAVRVNEPSPMQTMGDTGVIFDITERSAAPVAADSPDLLHTMMMLKDEETFFSTMDALNRFIPDAQAAAAPSGS